MPEITDTAVVRIHKIVQRLDEIYRNWNSGEATIEDIHDLKNKATQIAYGNGLPFIYNPPVSERDAELIEAGEYTTSYTEDEDSDGYEDSYEDSEDYWNSSEC